MNKQLVFILVLSLIIRLIGINQSLWLDEAISVIAALNNDYYQLIVDFAPKDFHPPLYYLILKFWMNLFGTSESILRLISVLSGVGTIFITYEIGKKLFNYKTGLIAAFLIALNPLHIYYSQEVRMYSLATFATTLCFYFFIRLSEKSGYMAVGYIISALLVMYTDYMPFFIFPAQFLFVIIFERKLLLRFISYLIISLLLFLPWGIILYQQFTLGIQTANSLPVWSQVVGAMSFKNFSLLFVKMVVGRISFENKLIYLGVVAFIFSIYALLILNIIKKLNKKYILLLCWFVIPIIISFIISIYIPIFSYFRLLYIIPAFFLIISSSISTLPSIWIKISLTIIVAFNLIFIYIFNTSPNYQRENWRSAVEISTKVYNHETLILFENNEVPAPFQYYSRTLNALPGLKRIPASTNEDLIETETIQNFNDILLFEYLVDITDPSRKLDQHIRSKNFENIKTYNIDGVGFIYHYKKLP